jgi:hypothetical protein
VSRSRRPTRGISSDTSPTWVTGGPFSWASK